MKFHYSVISYFKDELSLRQPVFTDSAFWPFTKNCKSSWCCVFQDLEKKNVSNKILKDRAYEIALNPRYGEHGFYVFW